MIMATATKQANRLLAVKTPLGEDALLIDRVSMNESISRPFAMQVDLLADAAKASSVSAEKLIGKKLTVKVVLEKGERYFNGIVSRFSEAQRDARYAAYRAEVVPWLWLLTLSSDCKVFQDKKVPEIIEEVLNEWKGNYSDLVEFQVNTTRDYKPVDYCVQYRETDFNFISRLMEQEGLFYFFRHEDDKHTMVIADAPGAHQPCPNQAEPRYAPEAGRGLDEDLITSLETRRSLVPGKYVHRDYHFEMPSKALEVVENSTVKVGNNGKLEIYDYPGEYAQRFDGVDQQPLGDVEPQGRELVRTRMQEGETPHLVISGTSTCGDFSAGLRLKIKGKDDQPFKVEGTEGRYVLTSVRHFIEQSPDYVSNRSVAEPYRNTFTCIPHEVPFRPARVTSRPVVQGLQSALVVGPKGEEIHTDKYGRIKVQFPWDRYGKTDESSSCWVRVAQQWAGKRWGTYFTPRIGQEVLVAFIEGDPDHPIIVGSVYNAEQMPPYLGDGPDDKHKNDPNVSGIKTNTTKGGQGFNELRFDDTKDKQQIFMHAERNMDVRVKNDSLERIYGNRHQIIGYEKDGKKGGDQREMVYQDKHLNIKRHQVEHIEGNYELLIGKGDASDGGNLNLVVEKDKKELIEKNSHLHIKGAHNEKVDQSVSLTVGMDRNEKIGMNHNMEAGMAIHVKAGMTLVLEAGVQLSLKVGGNFIDINPAGVFIQGTTVMINSGGAAGAGPGAQPQEPQDAKQATPTEPEHADNAKTGSKSC